MYKRQTYNAATAFCETLEARIPTEAEWEYLCRANSTDLFHWGNELPDYELIPEYPGQHAKAMTPIVGARNKLGFEALFWGEWMHDPPRENYEPHAQIRENSRVIRGGANALWPWQDCHEWLHCVSAGRRFVSSLEPAQGNFPPFNLDLKQSLRLAWPVE